MMTNRVDLCNLALAEVGEQAITSLGEQTRVAELCRRYMGAAVREVLNRGLWKCAREQAELSRLGPDVDRPLLGWSHGYQLPEDYIRLVRFNEWELWSGPRGGAAGVPVQFEVRGDKLLTNAGRVRVVYIRDLSWRGEDVHLMPPLLGRAVALNLAAKLAWPLQQSRHLKESLEQSCEVVLRQAKGAGAQEEVQPVLDQESGSTWLGARW